MTTVELVPWLGEHWASVRQALDAGTYRPSPVRRVVIPRPGGGERLPGVPSCLDRLIQQAIPGLDAGDWQQGQAAVVVNRGRYVITGVDARFCYDGPDHVEEARQRLRFAAPLPPGPGKNCFQ
jgi:hypothetical protein